MGRPKILETKQERNRRYYLKHRDKRIARSRAYREENPERVKLAAKKERAKNAARYKEYSKAWHQLKKLNEPEYHSLKHIQTRYGLSPGQFLDMQIKQNFCCYICNTPEEETNRKRLFVDHEHNTKKVRKLLCDPCNRMLADAKERPEVLRWGAEYLEEFACM